MNEVSGSIGFAVIVLLYISIGVLAAVGSATLTRKLLSPRWEQVFYAGFLTVIAGFYLAFAAYFKAADSWQLERLAVMLFAAFAVFGTRLSSALIFGYLLHGSWDLLHELQAHGAVSVLESGQATPIPLAYGAFCATFDLVIAAYFYSRRADWAASWKQV